MPAKTDPSPPLVWDATVLEALFGSDVALIRSVVHTFLDSTRGSVADLASAAAAGHLPAVADLAHRIKGASRMSGALALAQAAEELEQLARYRADAAPLLAGVAWLHREWERVQGACAA